MRKRALARLNSLPTQAQKPQSALETQRLMHELQVHQIQLEMQNEELQRSHAEVEEVLLRYTDLYDFAPVGYRGGHTTD